MSTTHQAAVTESLEIMGLKLMADCVRASETTEIDGWIELTQIEAEKRGEIAIAERMKRLLMTGGA